MAAVDQRPDGLDGTRAAAGSMVSSLSVHVADVTDRERVCALPAEVERAHGQVDAVVNNAGIIQPFLRLQDLSQDTMERVMRVNFYGTLWVVRAFLPYLLARPEAHIVNVASMGGFLPVPGQTVYGASKAAVMLLTEGLRAELQGTPVWVTLVLPGAMRTEIALHSGVELPRTAARVSTPVPDPERAARVVVDAVERNAFRVLVGRDARTMDLSYRLSPFAATRLVQRRMAYLLPGSLQGSTKHGLEPPGPSSEGF